MKKVLLGLILSVGMSGMAMANSDTDNDLILDCYHGYSYTAIDCDGARTTVNLGGNAGDCESEADGTIILHRKIEHLCTPDAATSQQLNVISQDYFNF